jgi:hypothetical protein
MLRAIYLNCIAFTLNSGIDQLLIMEAVTSFENVQNTAVCPWYCDRSAEEILLCL